MHFSMTFYTKWNHIQSMLSAVSFVVVIVRAWFSTFACERTNWRPLFRRYFPFHSIPSFCFFGTDGLRLYIASLFDLASRHLIRLIPLAGIGDRPKAMQRILVIITRPNPRRALTAYSTVRNNLARSKVAFGLNFETFFALNHCFTMEAIPL